MRWLNDFTSTVEHPFYCLLNFLFGKLFTPFTYFFFIGLSFWFCFTQVIYTVWTWIHYCLTVSWFIVSGFPVQLCIILWELQDFNYDTVEFTNISCFMIFLLLVFCFGNPSLFEGHKHLSLSSSGIFNAVLFPVCFKSIWKSLCLY